MMRRSIAFATPHMTPIRTQVPSAEAEGLHGVWFTEYTDRDALIRATLAASVSTDIAVGTGISYSFTRHPLALAAAALDVHEASSGRFRLGLGTGTAGMRGRWFGLSTDRPVARLKETVALLRSAWESEGDFAFRGSYFSADVPALSFRGRVEEIGTPPIYGSGIGPGMVTAAATWCDGAVLHPLAVGQDYEARFLNPAIEEGLENRELDAPFDQVQWVITAVDDDLAKAYNLARRALAFYLATASYTIYFADTAWAAVQLDLLDGFRARGADWPALAERVPIELVDEFCIVGSPSSTRARVEQLEERLAGRGVSELVFQVAATGVSAREAEAALERVIHTVGTVPSVPSVPTSHGGDS
ncbi:LLM class flavin-dependent oxidoreductase [soil metagenome]